MARLCPLFSGSSGNAYFFGSSGSGVLIDAGRSARQLENMFRLCRLDPLAVGGILVTHEHTDHISGIRVFASKYQIPVYASPGTVRAISPHMQGVSLNTVSDKFYIDDMEIIPFHTSHDCAEPLGFRIISQDQRVLGFATDLGYVSDEVISGLSGADTVVIESNHDVRMLEQGGYPYYLKQRILSREGHLSNDTCAALLPKLVKSGVKRILLGHLSRENNTQELALMTASAALSRAGYKADVDYRLEAAAPENMDGRIILF